MCTPLYPDLHFPVSAPRKPSHGLTETHTKMFITALFVTKNKKTPKQWLFGLNCVSHPQGSYVKVLTVFGDGSLKR